MKESRFVKTKIVAGYAILVVACILSVGYVYYEVVRLTGPDDSYAQLRAKRQAVNRTLYHLYQAESYGQLMIAGYGSYEKPYKDEMQIVRSDLDSLRNFLAPGDSMQLMRLDSISELIAGKQRRTMNLRQGIRLGSTAALLDKNIDVLIGEAEEPVDSVVRVSVPQEQVRQDTVHVSRPKRRFLRRIADVFNPPKEVPDVVISREVTRSDTVAANFGRDTITHLLRTLQERVTNDRMEVYSRAWNEGARLQLSNALINEKIYNLIADFEAESTAYVLNRIEQTNAIRERSLRILGAISACAIVLMLLFVAILWRDINRSNRYRRALEQADREKGELLAAREKLMLAITHDIKAPLGSILGYIDLLTRLTPEKRQRLYLQHMKDSADHLLALVGSLLDFHRLDAKKIDISEVPFCPARLFETICEGFVPVAAQKGLSLELELNPSVECNVAGDMFRIRQIAENLLSNAVKFTDQGCVSLQAELEDGRLVFRVRDTGRGIAKEDKDLIFREFIRLPSAQGVEGFGLGLSIVDRLVQLLGGRIWFESIKGQGTRFTVSIPVKPAVVAKDGVCDPVADVPMLFIDDDPLQLEMVTAMCREAGFSAEACQYPEYAAKLVAERGFGLVFTDIQMPGMDGFQVLEAVCAAAPGVRVVAVTARSDNAATEFLSRGFAAVLRKPFTRNELRQAIRTACGVCAEAAPHPAAVGLDALTAYADDDADAAHRILRSFADQTAENCRTLSRALAEGDEALLRATAHKMLPIFTMMDESEIAGMLRRLETGQGALTPAMHAEVEKMLENIGTIIGQAQKRISL